MSVSDYAQLKNFWYPCSDPKCCLIYLAVALQAVNDTGLSRARFTGPLRIRFVRSSVHRHPQYKEKVQVSSGYEPEIRVNIVTILKGILLGFVKSEWGPPDQPAVYSRALASGVVRDGGEELCARADCGGPCSTPDLQ
ncbi:hypothetical protein NDU88_006859 [Pleurodeles waltl]|uniref:Uncharacterized protein n=1 Tax=Pleurodeles waltl TaxID=8319 RepID=A0AAV7SQR5_PLEWA|nr:hypothetical protein NDU88_006859 [Pleurodeles waltl]